MSELPEPPVPRDLDLTDTPPPRDLFIAMAVEQFGISEEEATALVDLVLGGINRVH